MNKVFIIINGSTCVGKTSVIEALGKLEPELFHLSYDRIKWCYLGYTAKTHADKVYDILELLQIESIKQGLPMVKDGGIFKVHTTHLINNAKDAGYRIVQVNLSAPKEVLFERFQKRVRDSQFVNIKLGNVKEERFWELYTLYEENKDEALPTYDTTQMTSEEIAKKILELCDHYFLS